MSSKHWKRKLRISVGGTMMNLDDLQTEITVRGYHGKHPDYAYFRITNLSDKTSNAIFQKGAMVTIYAGYHEGPYGQIFAGEAHEMRRGKMNGTDTYHDCLAIDGHRAFSYATVSKTMDKNASMRDIIQEAAKAMEQYGVRLGNIGEIGELKLHRGVTLNDMAHNILSWVAETTDSTWSISNGKINFVRNGDFMPGAYVLNADSGLIGIPEQTFDGIVARILINPNIKIGSQVKIDAKSITQYIRKSTDRPEQIPLEGILPGITADGIYKVERVDHDLDLHGQSWYTTLTCIATGAAGKAGANIQSDTKEIRGVTETEGSAGAGGPT